MTTRLWRLDRCFQLMKTNNPNLLDVWRARWQTSSSSGVFPVSESREVVRRANARWGLPLAVMPRSARSVYS